MYIRFGLRIASLRHRRRITQQELAQLVGLTRTSVTNVEGGRQRVLLDDVEKFAAALGMRPQALLRGIFS